jgi:hypothetical protein
MSASQLEAAAPPEAAESVLKVLQAAGLPLTVAQLKKAYDGPTLSDKRLLEVLREHERSGRAFRCSPLGKSPRFWVHDEEQRARDKLDEILADKALTNNQLVKTLGEQLATGSTKAWRERLVKKLQGEGRFHVHPVGGRHKARRLSLQPPDPRDYIPKGLLKNLAAVCKKLERAGVPPGRVLEVVSQAVLPTAPSADGTEVEGLILKGMYDLERDADQGALVSLRELRRSMPERYRGQETFDSAVFRLAERGLIVLHKHNVPGDLTEEERRELVQDEQGNVYVGIAQRV